MIRVEGFSKCFYVGVRRRKSQATTNVTFNVEKGEVFGFLGPNGSGKSTTIKALLGLIHADSGTLELMGHPSTSMGWKKHVGYMPEHPTFYDFLTGFEMVVWFGRLSGMTRHDAEKEAKSLLERVGLAHAMHRRLRGYSKGMFQRAGIAQAMINHPELLILDEPMTGLDPIGRKEIRELILSLKAEGKTICYSTHILPDVEMTCDRVSILHKGATRRTGPLAEILSETSRGVEVVLAGLPTEKVDGLKAKYEGAKFSHGALEIFVPETDEAQSIVSEALAAGASLIKFQPHKDDLESIFVRSLGGEEGVLQA